MRLEKVSATDFLCFKSLDLPLSEQGLVCLLGRNLDTESANSNGSGKSSLFKAISWGLFGQTVDGMRFDEVIRKGATKATVGVYFRRGEQTFQVLRERSKGKPRLSILGPEGPLDSTAEGLQAQIERWLGMDFQAFKNTVLYGQGDAVRFADPRTTDTERKEMLFRILRMEILGTCHELSLARRKVLVSNIEKRDQDVARLQAQVDGVCLDGLREQASRWEEEREVSVSTMIETARGYLAEARAGMKEPRTMLEALRSKLSKLEKTPRELGVDEKLMSTLRKDLDLKQKGMKTAEVELARLLSDRSGIDKSLSRLDGDVCPICTSPLNEGAPAALRKDLEEKRHATFTREEAILLDVDSRRVEVKGIQERIDEELAKAKSRSRSMEKRLQDERELRLQIRGLEIQESESEKKKARAADLLKRVAEKREETSPFTDLITEAEKKVESIGSKMETVNQENERDRHSLSLTEFWVRGFSPKGLPSYILDRVMVLLTDRSNHYLRTLSDGDIQVSFTTQRELKSKKGEVRDEIAISWQIEGQDGVQPSGGQWKKIEIATDLALMDLVATKEETSCGILLLDEVLDGLDREGRRRVVTLLRELRERKETVMVISHEPDLLDEFERVLTVTKKDGVSTLTSGGEDEVS
jgi:DNA repair exonuclease SbcCD ATPase subunit